MNNVPLICNRAVPLLVNRDGSVGNGGWVHIVPKGELPNKESGIVQVLDDKALDAIIANLNADRDRLGDNWPGLYMGEEHFIYDPSKSSEAFAWPKEFQKREDGIWANVAPEVTDIGAAAIKNKRFKYTSFAVDPKTPGAVERVSGKNFRILKIETVGFTNFPNGRDLLAPVTNRFPGGAGASSAEAKNQNQNKTMKSVATKLGLSADASEEAVLAEVSKFVNRGDISVADLTTLRNRATELETGNKTLLEEQVDALLDAHGIKADDKVRNRIKPVLVVLKNREDRVAALADFGYQPVDPKAGKGAQSRVLNRGTGGTTGGASGAVDENDERAVADKIRNRATELTKGGMSQDNAWAQARQECAAK